MRKINYAPSGVSSFLLSIMLFSFSFVIQAEEYKVKITNDLAYLDVIHNGETIRIERIQDTSNHLNSGFAKTSRPCPPFCVRPIKLTDGVKTVGEMELLNFLATKVKNGQGVLVDARMPEWFEKGTIPSAVNIPFTILTGGIESAHTKRIIKLLGAVEKKDGTWDFSKARELLLFCNGLWCGQSPRAIKSLIKIGYPEEKMFWYRGGMQAWQLLGLTTVTP